MHSTVSRSGLATVLACFGWITISTAQTTVPATPNVAVGGVVYTQYLYQVKDTANHVNNFYVTRAYLMPSGSLPVGSAPALRRTFTAIPTGPCIPPQICICRLYACPQPSHVQTW